MGNPGDPTMNGTLEKKVGRGAVRRGPAEQVAREVRPAPDRYRNPLGRYRIGRSADCAACGTCAAVCPHGVHIKPQGYRYPLRPRDHLCIGPECAGTDRFCVARCPHHALTLARNPSADILGDARWSSDLILSTWHQAETGTLRRTASNTATACRAADSTGFGSGSRPGRRATWIRPRSTPGST